MHFVDCLRPGGPEVLRIAEAPTPVPGQGDVLIRVEAAGVNRPDLLQRQGKYPPPPGASPILGLEVAGVIVSADPVSRWKPGDRVCALVPGGGYADYCLTPGAHCLPIPTRLSVEEAAGIPETYFTVWANVFQTGTLQPEERILVHGGASGIGTTAIQLAHAFGATVYTTAGTEEKCAACRKLGAAAAINYVRQDFVQEVRALTNGEGVHLVLDIVGGTYAARNLECLAHRGRLIQIAVQQGAEATINLTKIIRNRLTLTGSAMRPRTVADKAQIARDLEQHVWPLLESGRVRAIVDRVFPFSEVAAAHRYLESGAHIGKVILKVA
ncbi:MAG TPA: NAD(P)H-quinone oxidoreductase [Candidatus Acidoferrales bacterium]|nr:NAD(P)H-quinone oxidoreductase [Candidatus Acidoferrales bacterium]